MLVKYWRTNLSDYKDYEKAVRIFDEKMQSKIKILEFRKNRDLPLYVQMNYMYEKNDDIKNKIKIDYCNCTIPFMLCMTTCAENYHRITSLTYTTSSFLTSFKFISECAVDFARNNILFSADLSHMIINYIFYESEEIMKLPKCLKKLEFNSHSKFLEYIDFTTCEMLFEIEFGHEFNRSLKNIQFPNMLRNIYFGDNFNKSLEGVKFPNSLVSIVFGKYYNKSLKNVIFPKFLERIDFGLYFNQSLEDGDFPDSITELIFGDEFNQPLQNTKFPNSLKSISFGKNYSQYLTDVEITPNLKTFIFKTKNIINMLNTIPAGITKIYFIDPNFNGTTKINFIDSNFNGTTKITNLPMTIKKIFLKNDNVIQNFQKIPLNCKIIVTPTTLTYYY